MSYKKGTSVRVLSRLRALPHRIRVFGFTLILMMIGVGAYAIIVDLQMVGTIHSPVAEHIDQATLKALVANGHNDQAFEEAFEIGDELFADSFNALDGSGGNVGNGERFTHVPRADMVGPDQWANHFPERATGPNAQACTSCHVQGGEDGGVPVSGSVHRDPTHSGMLSQFIERNGPATFGSGGLQRLGEEISLKLQSIRQSAKDQACANGGTVTKALSSKGVSYGNISATRTATNPCVVTFNTTAVSGVSPDLVVRPFQWKGSVAFLRDFNRGAAHNELGMQAVELVGADQDGDFDGVANEFTIGDQTALAVYTASQPRPTSKIELAAFHLIPALTQDEVGAIARGAVKFVEVGCANCHLPVMTLDSSIFTEPSQNGDFRDIVFPAGQNPITEGVDPAFAIKVDLTKDQPDNVLLDNHGRVKFRLGSFRKVNGKAIVELFGDLKRHDMGPGLAESIDEVGTGASVFMTENLWGVGTTAPYMHDGRSTTLTEAILEHGGESSQSRTNFVNLSTASQKDLCAFLDNLVLFKLPED